MLSLAEVSALLGENAFIRSHEMKLIRLETGLCVGKMPFRADHKNHLGHMHGGVSYAFADVIAGALAHADGHAVTTTGGEIHYLKGIYDIDEIFCTAQEIKKGRTLSVYDVRITDEAGERMFACGTFTYFTLEAAI